MLNQSCFVDSRLMPYITVVLVSGESIQLQGQSVEDVVQALERAGDRYVELKTATGNYHVNPAHVLHVRSQESS